MCVFVARDSWIVSTLTDIQCKLDTLSRMVQSIVKERASTISLPDGVELPLTNDIELEALEEACRCSSTTRDNLVS